MEIDRNTGQLSVHADFKIGPRTTLDEFLLSSAGRAAKKGVENGAYRSFAITSVATDETFYLTLTFKNQSLQMVTAQRASPEDPRSWAEWSEEGEQKRKRVHDDWLEARFGKPPFKIRWRGRLGKPPYELRWGSVTSQYDPRSGSSSIVITYKGPTT